MLLEQFNELEPEQAIAVLRPCIDIDRWVSEIVADRPFVTIADLCARAETAANPYTVAEVEQAMAHHPRIGERAQGASAEASLSRSEQAGLDPDQAVAEALRAGNRAYEEKFGRVFLIRAAGRSASDILASLEKRMTHTPAEEDQIVAEQLRQIAILRLKGLFS